MSTLQLEFVKEELQRDRRVEKYINGTSPSGPSSDYR
jgi:hypothetical protein